MAISTYFKTDKVVSIEEFIAFVDENIDISDDDSVVSAGEMLQGLANNKDYLIDTFNRDLLKYGDSPTSSYSQSSAMLGTGKRKAFVVRANMWPPSEKASLKSVEDLLFSYDLAHDHNFSFLTANYFGSGYETDIWECANPEVLVGYEGEPVHLTFLEHTMLEPGKQMYFRRRKDIHIQHPPKDYSASLNLLIASKTDLVTDQFEYDVNSKTIKTFPKGTIASRRAFFMEMAGAIGNQNTTDLLLKIAENHPCQRTRASALKSAIQLNSSVLSHISPKVKDDPSPFIRAILENNSGNSPSS